MTEVKPPSPIKKSKSNVQPRFREHKAESSVRILQSDEPEATLNAPKPPSRAKTFVQRKLVTTQPETESFSLEAEEKKLETGIVVSAIQKLATDKIFLLRRDLLELFSKFTKLGTEIKGQGLYAATKETFEEWNGTICSLVKRSEEVVNYFERALMDGIDESQPSSIELQYEVEKQRKIRKFSMGDVVTTALSKHREKSPTRTNSLRRSSVSPARNAKENTMATTQKGHAAPFVTSFFKQGTGNTMIASAQALQSSGTQNLGMKSLPLAQSLHFLLDGAMRAVQAERCVILIPHRGDIGDLRAISATGFGPDAKLNDLRIRSTESAPSLTLQTGMIISCCRGHNPVVDLTKNSILALEQELNRVGAGSSQLISSSRNVMADVPSGGVQQATTAGKNENQQSSSTLSTILAKQWSSLSVPIRRNVGQVPVGVLHVLNKNMGRTNFDTEDEHLAYGTAELIASVLERVDDFDIVARLYDPQLPMPFVKSSLTTPAQPPGCREQLVYHTWDLVKGKEIKILQPDLKSAVRLDESIPILQVAEYIQSLQAMWKQAITMNMDYQRVHEERTAFIKKLVERCRLAEMRNQILRGAVAPNTDVEHEIRPSFLPPPGGITEHEEEEEDGSEDNETKAITPQHEETIVLMKDQDSDLQKAQEESHSTTTADYRSPPEEGIKVTPDAEEPFSLFQVHSTSIVDAPEHQTVPEYNSHASPDSPPMPSSMVTFRDGSKSGSTSARTTHRSSTSQRGASWSISAAVKTTSTSSSTRLLGTKTPISLMLKDERQASLKLQKPHYLLGGVIGTGAVGKVYLALIEETGESVAAKLITFSPEEPHWEKKLKSLQNEVNLLRGLDHPNIVRYLFTDRAEGATENGLYIFMEYVAGGNLLTLSRQFGKVSDRTIVLFAAQLLLGLEVIHGQGIIHRDIKPANCLLTPLGDVKVADFGTAVILEEGQKVEAWTGTPYYMAPEVLRGESPIWQNDIWSYGCTILELLTGQQPWTWQRSTPLAVLEYVMNLKEDPELPDTISPNATKFLKACLQHDPTQRPTTTTLLRHEWFASFDLMMNSQNYEANVENTGLHGELMGSVTINPKIRERLLSSQEAREMKHSIEAEYEKSITNFDALKARESHKASGL